MTCDLCEQNEADRDGLCGDCKNYRNYLALFLEPEPAVVPDDGLLDDALTDFEEWEHAWNDLGGSE
jgi:hypothetical protein